MILAARSLLVVVTVSFASSPSLPLKSLSNSAGILVSSVVLLAISRPLSLSPPLSSSDAGTASSIPLLSSSSNARTASSIPSLLSSSSSPNSLSLNFNIHHSVIASSAAVTTTGCHAPKGGADCRMNSRRGVIGGCGVASSAVTTSNCLAACACTWLVVAAAVATGAAIAASLVKVSRGAAKNVPRLAAFR